MLLRWTPLRLHERMVSAVAGLDRPAGAVGAEVEAFAAALAERRAPIADQACSAEFRARPVHATPSVGKDQPMRMTSRAVAPPPP